MALDDPARLERFRRVASEFNLEAPDASTPVEEINSFRDLLNAVIYPNAQPWMLPSWAVLSLKGLDLENTILHEFPNSSYRNWSLVGGVGARNYGIVDSRGLASARADIGSIDVWLQDEDEIIFPALIGKDGPQLHLVSSEDQLYEWRTGIKSIDFVRLVYHAKQGDDEFLFNEIVLRNIALEKAEATFYVVIRPMSPWGVDPLERIEYDDSNNQIDVNGIPALHFDSSPSAVILTEADNSQVPELIRNESSRTDSIIESKRGLAMASIRFDIKLMPAGSKRILFVTPLESTARTTELSKLDLGQHIRDQTVGEWYAFSNHLVEVKFPDSELDEVFSQAAVSLALQARSVMFPAESFLAAIPWHDRMRILSALIKTGSMDLAEKLVIEIAQHATMPGEHMDRSIFSPILWGILQFYNHNPTSASITKTRQYIDALTERVVGNILSGKEESSNLPEDDIETVPLEHYLIIDDSVLQELNQSLWDLAAMKESLHFHVGTKKPLVDQLLRAISQIESVIQRKFAEIQTGRWPRPDDSVMQDIDYRILDILTSAAQLRLTHLNMDFLSDFCERVTRRRVVRNLWKTGELFSSHLALRLAHFHVFDGQRNRIENYLQRSLEFVSEDYLLPDYVDTRTYGGSGGTGSSVSAAADIILLLTEMLVHEDMPNLVFLTGIPDEWYTSKSSLIVKDIPTRFGRANIEVGMSTNQHQIETQIEDLPEEIEIHVPTNAPLRMIKAYGGSIIFRSDKARSPHLRLVPLSNEIVLTYHK
ncbi:MAG: hypothetical protein ACFFCP_09615 [Promethearchaeota archaeon]